MSRLDYILFGHAPYGRESIAFEDQAVAPGITTRYFAKKQNELKQTVNSSKAMLSLVQL